METVVRNVRDIDATVREALEDVVGQKLRENQQLIIQVVSVGVPAAKPAKAGGGLPEWCNVYDGLTDAEIEDIEKSIVRSPGGRSFD